MAGSSTYDRKEADLEFGRILNFSDGVFAIAMTLLILTIDIPSVPVSELPSALADQIDALLSYFITFAVLTMFWIHHHQLFAKITRFDLRLAALNMLYLCFVVLTPLTTELLGKYQGAPISVAVYAVTISLAGVSQNLIFFYTSKAHLEEGKYDLSLGGMFARYLAAPAVFLLSVPLAFISTSLAMWSWCIAFIAIRVIEKRFAVKL